MIKLVIFDLDGVLIDSKGQIDLPWHELLNEALNRALGEEYAISIIQEHLAIYDGYGKQPKQGQN